MWKEFETYFKIVIRPKNEKFVIFLDDSLRNFVASHKILGLLVASSSNTQDKKPVLTRYANKIWFQYDFQNTYDAISGIPTASFYLLANTVLKHTNNIESIILDWDKTLSVHSSFKMENINKRVMECYFGGTRRMQAMTHFFKICKKNKVNVMVLTANSRAKYDVQAFQKGLSYVKADWVPVMFTDMTKTTYINKM